MLPASNEASPSGWRRVCRAGSGTAEGRRRRLCFGSGTSGGQHACDDRGPGPRRCSWIPEAPRHEPTPRPGLGADAAQWSGPGGNRSRHQLHRAVELYPGQSDRVDLYPRGFGKHGQRPGQPDPDHQFSRGGHGELDLRGDGDRHVLWRSKRQRQPQPEQCERHRRRRTDLQLQRQFRVVDDGRSAGRDGERRSHRDADRDHRPGEQQPHSGQRPVGGEVGTVHPARSARRRVLPHRCGQRRPIGCEQHPVDRQRTHRRRFQQLELHPQRCRCLQRSARRQPQPHPDGAGGSHLHLHHHRILRGERAALGHQYRESHRPGERQ